MRPRACIVYSVGPHFERALKVLRTRQPASEIIALVPASLPLDETLAGLVDRIEVQRSVPAGARGLRSILALARAVRGTSCDAVAVLYPALGQQAVAALSGARERLWIGPDGHVTVLTSSVAGLIAAAIRDRVRGAVVYGRMWWQIRLTPVRPQVPARKEPTS